MPGEYGVVTEVYTYVTFLTIVFTYGLETAFFRYSEKEKGNPLVYSTSLISIISTSLFFAALILLFAPQISDALKTGESVHRILPQYISWFGLVLAFDAITAILFARLRQQNKPMRFALIKMVNIGTNVGLNLFFLVICPRLMNSPLHDIISKIYYPEFGVGYVFIVNLIASVATLLCLSPEIFSIKFKVDPAL